MRKANTGDLGAEWRASQSERDEAYEKILKQRLTARGMRQEVAEVIRQRCVKGQLSDASYPKFLKSTRAELGAEVMPLVSKARAAQLASMWFRNQRQYPFYSAFIDGLQYSLFRAAAEHQKPIDTNAQADYEQLAYMTWADVIVTNETKFMSDAFKAIWLPRGKLLQTTEAFTDLTSRLDRT
jgi:hypothetical protein